MRAPVRPLIDATSLRAELDALAAADPANARAVLAARIRNVVAEGRARAQALLEEERDGYACARRICGLMDDVLRALHGHVTEVVFSRINASAAERLAIVAVGGFGRGTLAPGSDIDVLFLLPYKQTAWGESVVETLLYILWDAGVKIGPATRSVDECIRQAKADMTVRTALLDIRPLAGHVELVETLNQRFEREVVEGSAADFVSAKLTERDERHARSGGSRYLVEPNIKDGKGGLRDLHTLFWIAKYVYRVRSIRELVAAGLFTEEERQRFRACEDFLWTVRCHLHFLTGRAEERLTFDLQREIAPKLGYQPHPGLKDVERFMKHYFLVAKDVGDLTAIVCAALEVRQTKSRPALDRFLRPFARVRRRPVPDSADFVVDNARLTVASEDVFEKDPVNLIRFFHIADKLDMALHPDAVRLITRSLKLITPAVREDKEANRLFMEILTSRNAPATLLRNMNETGVLGRFVKEFGRIVALMQFNMYHHYTVDEHLIRTIGILSDMDAGRLKHEHPLSAEILPTLENRKLLYVTLFLHDIAKGRPEDHSVAGARIARKLCPRFGLTPGETETVAWLIENHLLMSMTAQSRDLSDARTIADFAAVVQQLERLKMLLVITVADIKAVGPGVWNGWKGQLLRLLYWDTELVLAGGHTALNRDERVSKAKKKLSSALDWPAHEVEAYVARHHAAYWLKVDLDRQIAQANFLRDAEEKGRTIATCFTSDAFRSITEITVLAPDHPYLLSTIAGACAAAGGNIVDAYIHTTNDNKALDSIFLTRAFENDDDEKRQAERLCAAIERALRDEGKGKVKDSVAKRAEQRARRTRAFDIEPQVTVTNAWSDRYTVIEVSGLDRPGLLYELTSALSSLNLNIASAHIATFGERAVDVFYITDLAGARVVHPNTQTAIRRRMQTVLD